jgi:hypothetical protein
MAAPAVAATPKPKRTRAPRKPKVEAPAAGELQPTNGLPPEPEAGAAPTAPLARRGKTTATALARGEMHIFDIPFDAPTDLSPRGQRREYEKMQHYVDAGMNLYYVVGMALGEIRDRQYFKLDQYDTFEDFIRERWDLGSLARASQLITAARVTDGLKKFFAGEGAPANPLGLLPETESHARALAKLKTVEEQAEAWLQAIDTAPERRERKHLVASHIDAVVQRLLGFKALPEDTGKGTDTPTPGTQPNVPAPSPETEVRPEDTEPVDAGAPPIGQEPDTLEAFNPEEHVAGTVEVKTKGRVKVLSPRVALEYLIEALQMGSVSHADPYIAALVEVVNGGLGDWLDSETDAVSVDAGHIQRPADEVIEGTVIEDEDGAEGDEGADEDAA